VTLRTASCRCGQLQAECDGEPVRISVCHCLDCQKRSGSAFSVQARWPDEQVKVTGLSKTWEPPAEEGRRASFRFCPDCGSTISYTIEALPGLTAVPIGCFAEPGFPQPHYSVYEERKQRWVQIVGDGIEHLD
jgi:hypothetical protein